MRWTNRRYIGLKLIYMERPDFFTLKNGEKVKLPFSEKEYERRVNNLRTIME